MLQRLPAETTPNFPFGRLPRCPCNFVSVVPALTPLILLPGSQPCTPMHTCGPSFDCWPSVEHLPPPVPHLRKSSLWCWGLYLTPLSSALIVSPLCPLPQAFCCSLVFPFPCCLQGLSQCWLNQILAGFTLSQ